MKDFFVSYHGADKAWAEWIAWTLEEAGYTVVIQAWEFRSGGNFVLEMQKAAKETGATIAVLSDNYLSAEYTQGEWAAAFALDPEGKKRALIPVRIAKCSPSGLLKALIYVDLIGLPEDAARDSLLGALRMRAKPRSAPTFPGGISVDGPPIEIVPAYPGSRRVTPLRTVDDKDRKVSTTAEKVYISYSHDSPEHAARVAGLAASLRRDGVDCRIDQYVDGTPPQGWPLWMEKTIEWAEFVLVVCTETYLRRVRKEEPPGKGLGATWEAHLIYLHLYETGLFEAKFIPVIFDGADKEFIPLPLRSAGHHLLDKQKGYERLYATITGQHQAPPHIGKVKQISQPQASPLFGKPGLEALTAAQTALKQPRLKPPSAEPYPTDPYPFLRPYKHPVLFTGRERDLDRMENLLSEQITVLGLYSTSGAGKSSLLQAGLSARLRRKGWPVAYTAYPTHRDLAKRLLLWRSEKTPTADDPDSFRESVRTAHTLSVHPVILVLDQFEDAMDPSAGEARERIGSLLTATIEQEPICRWVLSYRHEYHGRVEEWLQEAFDRAGVAWRGHWRTYPLEPFGTTDAEATFLSAIQAPLRIEVDGKPLYRFSFSEGGAERLARGFAHFRETNPTAALLPDLQAVLAHLLRKAGWPSKPPVLVEVPGNPQELIDHALSKYLKWVLNETIPDNADHARRRRAEVILVLRDLATADGRRNQGLPARRLARTLNKTILRKISGFGIIHLGPGERYTLADDSLATALLSEVAKEGLDQLEPAARSMASWALSSPVTIQAVRLRNIRVFADTGTVHLTAESRLRPLTLLLGPNSAGKSTFLQSIALASLGPELANLVEHRPESFLRNGADRGWIEVRFQAQLEIGNSFEEFCVGLEIREGENRFRAMADLDLALASENAAEDVDLLRRRKRDHLGFLCAYGPWRTIAGDASSLMPEEPMETVDRVVSLFDPRTVLMDPDVLAKMLAGDLSNFRTASRDRLREQDRICMSQHISELLPDSGKLVTESASLPLHGHTVPLRELSDGYGSLLAIIGHLFRHALSANDWSGDPAQIHGVLLIDEVDLHLHPSWQRRVLPDLRRVFRNLQIIASSHSPMVAGSVETDSVVVFRREDTGEVVISTGFEPVQGWRADQILTSLLFDLPTSRSLTMEVLSAKYAKLLNERGPEDDEVRQLGKQLSQVYQLDGEGIVDIKTHELLDKVLAERFKSLDPETRKLVLAKAGLVISSNEG